MKTLIVVPGLSSPTATDYKPVYALLREEAIKKGYDQCEVLVLPGQMREDGSRNGQLGLVVACEAVRECIERHERDGNCYRIIALSFGCTVALNSVVGLQQLVGLEKIVLWGPIPFWRLWRSFCQGVGRDKLAKDTVTKNGRDFFDEVSPNEFLITQIAYRIMAATGTRDQYCTPAYIEYLKDVVAKEGKQNITFSIVEGCEHNVRRDSSQRWEGYIDVVFN